DEEQKKATLWDGHYRDGTPFRDLVFQYTDEFRDCHTAPDGSQQCDAHQHTYAIPAKHRCIQCHEGAEGKNFVLGFTPLQINRRPAGDGGLLAPVGDDELTQVDRLVAYGVVDIAGGAASLPTLETSAGDRLPRTDFEA